MSKYLTLTIASLLFFCLIGVVAPTSVSAMPTVAKQIVNDANTTVIKVDYRRGHRDRYRRADRRRGSYGRHYRGHDSYRGYRSYDRKYRRAERRMYRYERYPRNRTYRRARPSYPSHRNDDAWKKELVKELFKMLKQL